MFVNKKEVCLNSILIKKARLKNVLVASFKMLRKVHLKLTYRKKHDIIYVPVGV
ncbi:hypothetical protein DSECCO2_490770 [anaerobic digester metagenome]